MASNITVAMDVLGMTNTAAISALQSGTLGISLGGGGFLVFYLIGVLDALVRLNIVVPGVTPVAGASAGALTTVAHCSGLSPPQIKEAALGLANACQREGNCFNNLDVQVRRLLRATLNPTSPQRCKGKGFVQVSRGTLGRTSPLLVSEYNSLADLTDAAAASAYIPLWSSRTVNTLFRGQDAVDGGVTNNQPCPPNVTYCLKVALTPYEFTPNSAGTLFTLFGIARRGPANARVSRRVSLPADNSYNESRVAEYHKFDSIDLRPNVYTPIPYNNTEWNEMVLIPGATNTLSTMYDMGKRDATLWAQRSGLAAAAEAMRKPAPAAAAAKPAAKVAAAAKPAAKAAAAAKPAAKAAAAAKPAAKKAVKKDSDSNRTARSKTNEGGN